MFNKHKLLVFDIAKCYTKSLKALLKCFKKYFKHLKSA